jgi:CO/xanthine dehydrogenase Mo-binding subunit
MIQAPPATLAGRLAEDEWRVDGNAKVSGQAAYSADASMEGMLWAAFVDSPVPHASIVSIDTTVARAMPGVHAVLTGRDIGERFFGRRFFDWPVLAIDRVRFIGEYVVAVAAETPEIARVAAASIDVTYEDLPPLFDPERACVADAPILHEHPEQYPTMFPQRLIQAHKNIQGHGILSLGDAAAAMARAERTFVHTFTTPRYHGGYLEPRATLVWIDDDGTVHVVSTNKSPFALRDALACCTGIEPEKIIIDPVFIGGDFGGKGLSIEEFPCYFLAAATGRPVKYVRAYSDDIRSTNTRHASRVHVRTGVMMDGTIVAQDIDALFDGGAFAAGKVLPDMLPSLEPKLPYRIRNFRLERTCVYTNSIPGSFIRAPGDVQLMFALESSFDMIADELGIDPLEMRRRNAVSEGDADVQGHPFLEPRAHAVLDALERETRWNSPLPAGRGRGMSLTCRHIGVGATNVQLILHADGHVSVRTGTTEQGVGSFTILHRVVAFRLGLDLAMVDVSRGSTAVAAPDPGVGANRTTHVSGRAALAACTKLVQELETVAAELANVPEALHLRDQAFISDDGRTNVTWFDAAKSLAHRHNGEFLVTGSYDGNVGPGEPEFNHFVGYAVEVTVDQETGQFMIDDVVMVADVGTIVNPVAHRGQIDGGFIFALGSATTEELLIEEGRILNLSFADYKLPTMRDIPPFRVRLIEAGTGPGPFGARAVGELNISGVGPAIANAIAAACGARVFTMPLTAERVYRALHGEE